MATESDLIRRYRGAFSSDECNEIISHIDFLNQKRQQYLIIPKGEGGIKGTLANLSKGNLANLNSYQLNNLLNTEKFN